MTKLITLIFLLSLMFVSCKKAEKSGDLSTADSLALTLDSDGDGVPDGTDGTYTDGPTDGRTDVGSVSGTDGRTDVGSPGTDGRVDVGSAGTDGRVDVGSSGDGGRVDVKRPPGYNGCKVKVDGEAPILIPISGKAVYNTSYCGAAAPSKEMLAQAASWKPLINAEVIFQSGEKEVRLTTDVKGAFAADLCEGKWKYFVTSNMDEDFKAINKSCGQYFSRSYGEIAVKPSGSKNYQLQYHFDCDPCGTRVKVQ